MSLLVNQARSPGEARVVYDRIAKVSRQFLNVNVYDAGHLPLDPQVPAAVRKRTPFVLASPKLPGRPVRSPDSRSAWSKASPPPRR